MPYKNKEEHRKNNRIAAKKWRLNNPRKRFSTVLKHRYNITLDQYDNMIINQTGRCKICNDNPQTLAVDHCHTTGVVRGLLCHNCNHGLGHFYDNVDTLKKAIKYLDDKI